MSPRNFARFFLTETGMTPAKFVEMARIDAARHYLGSTSLSIEVVSGKSGFTDPGSVCAALLFANWVLTRKVIVTVSASLMPQSIKAAKINTDQETSFHKSVLLLSDSTLKLG